MRRFFVITWIFLAACTTTSGDKVSGDRPFVITTLDLFAQTDSPKGAKPWMGDWEFRRDRLDIIDGTLKDLRPDIAIFQNAMQRMGSLSENDSLILKAGSMGRYEWTNVEIQNMPESGELRNLAVSVLRPAKVVVASTRREKAYWALGADGHMAVFEIQNLEEPLFVVNVLMPSRKDQVGLWYSFVKDRIAELIEGDRGCSARIVVAGYLPIDQDSRKASDFMTSLALKDTAIGFCQNASRCQTASLANEIYASTKGEDGSGQVDRILVHLSAQVLSANLSFASSRPTEQYKDAYRINTLYGSQRFGWTTKLRFASCPKK